MSENIKTVKQLSANIKSTISIIGTDINDLKSGVASVKEEIKQLALNAGDKYTVDAEKLKVIHAQLWQSYKAELQKEVDAKNERGETTTLEAELENAKNTMGVSEDNPLSYSILMFQQASKDANATTERQLNDWKNTYLTWLENSISGAEDVANDPKIPEIHRQLKNVIAAEITAKQETGDVVTQAKLEELVNAEISKLVDDAPENLNTLAEIAAELATKGGDTTALVSSIGVTGDLATTNKTSLVEALNEVLELVNSNNTTNDEAVDALTQRVATLEEKAAVGDDIDFLATYIAARDKAAAGAEEQPGA